MSLVEQNALKSRIKSWETDFYKINSRKPDKSDIKNAPQDIRDAYRNYWKMKNASCCSKSFQDDVWNLSLNKPSKKLQLKAKDKVIEHFCDKLKKRIGVKNVSFQPSISSEQQIADIKASTEILAKESESLTSENQTEKEPVINFKFRINKISEKLDKLNDFVKKVNVLSPAISLNNKELYFKKNINNDWLERCETDLPNKFNALDNREKLLPKYEVKNTSCDSVSILNEDIFNFHASLNNQIKNIEFQEDNKDTSENKFNNFVDSDSFVNEPIKIKSPVKNIQEVNEIISSQTVESDPGSLPNNDPYTFESQISEGEDNHQHTEKKSIKRKLGRSNAIQGSKAMHLEKKIAAGTLNENYIRVNIKKKKFSLGFHSTNVRKLKWRKWKDLKNKSASGSCDAIAKSTCFKCGQIGHWARNCTAISKETNFFTEDEDFVETPLPTLEEAALLAKTNSSNLPNANIVKLYKASDSNLTDTPPAVNKTDLNSFDNLAALEDNVNCFVKPLYNPLPNGNIIKTPEEVFEALLELGYKKFRSGQEIAVMRVLSGLSTLVVLPTGSGKSLCYQLPAYMYAKQSKCLALVISPLVSLMEDQVIGLPSCLHAVCLHSGMTDVQKKNSLRDISEGTAHIVLVSPEAVIGSNAFGSGLLPPNMPPISFACIDEAHCLSQWSHNFRPSYLQLYKALTQKFGIKCILGLTATATQIAAKDIVCHLGLELNTESIVGCTNVPKNLHISASKDKDRDRALIQLLSGNRFCSCSSIIIYCIRRVETERLAALIRTSMQDLTKTEDPPTKKKSKKRSFVWTAEAYHAGLTPAKRKSVQKQFMSGKLRVVVATVAFGMGLDKADVRAIIHFNMPKSFESYVQEIGRAGRDGLDAHCHLFLDNQGNDLYELRRYIYSNGTDRRTLRKLLQKVFQPCKCTSLSENLTEVSQSYKDEYKIIRCPKHEIAFSMNETVQELDMKEENILTLLCYLELHPEKWIEIQPHTYLMCAIRCYGGPKQMHSIACKSAPVATAIALDAKQGKNFEKLSHYQFPVVQVSSFMGKKSSVVKRELKSLEWNEHRRKSGVLVEFSDLAFHLLAPGNLSADELDSILDYLHNKTITSEKEELNNLNFLFSVFQKHSNAHYWECCDEVDAELSQNIKECINKYFERNKQIHDGNVADCSESERVKEEELQYAKSQIRDLICIHHDQSFTGRAVARILHGIGSPCYPPEIWGKVRRFWRSMMNINFNILIKIANQELKSLR